MNRWIAIAVLALAAAGCKQGLGERCQVDSDCGDGLVCNQAQEVCAASGTSGGIDADIKKAIDAGTDPG
jgi:hypothetical protein